MDVKEHVRRVEGITRWLGKKLGKLRPELAVIMGSGLSGCVPPLEDSVSISYADIPGFPQSTVQGHAGTLLAGKTKEGLGVAMMQGRFHYYEGHAIGDLAIPVRALYGLGVKKLIVTAAVGSVKRSVKPGDLVVLNDHINFMCRNPLRGIYDSRFGKMFTDMTEPYDPVFRRETLKLCKKLGIRATEGVYLAETGPSYETAAEIRAFAMLGADVVGMSTVPEVLVARQLGMRVLGLCWVTNLATGISSARLSHQEVVAQGKLVAVKFQKLLQAVLSLPQVRD